jgi:hypothetical protein
MIMILTVRIIIIWPVSEKRPNILTRTKRTRSVAAVSIYPGNPPYVGLT